MKRWYREWKRDISFDLLVTVGCLILWYVTRPPSKLERWWQRVRQS